MVAETKQAEDSIRHALIDDSLPIGWTIRWNETDSEYMPVWRFFLHRPIDGLELSGAFVNAHKEKCKQYKIELTASFNKPANLPQFHNWNESRETRPSVKVTASSSRPKWLQSAIKRLLPNAEVWSARALESYRIYCAYYTQRAAVIKSAACVLMEHNAQKSYDEDTNRIYTARLTADRFTDTAMRLEISSVTPDELVRILAALNIPQSPA